MSKPAWVESQIADRARTTDALGAAANQMNVLLRIAADLHAKGQDHATDRYWLAALAESRRLDAEAEVLGIDIHDIGAEAARRRSQA